MNRCAPTCVGATCRKSWLSAACSGILLCNNGEISKNCTIPVGAGSPANTGEAGAIYRVAFFAGEPAPTGISIPN
ncbi:protein of unknown function [Pseudomonas inefficax]|uniref:Uncharacterized protein n=1 Tax=Pseudomonas inefficax TaxID=2078786 RepID=A0AAQ1SVL6_9PSED|nr:protein of unknown function [Pseudomonas inefficax]